MAILLLFELNIFPETVMDGTKYKTAEEYISLLSLLVL